MTHRLNALPHSLGASGGQENPVKYLGFARIKNHMKSSIFQRFHLLGAGLHMKLHTRALGKLQEAVGNGRRLVAHRKNAAILFNFKVHPPIGKPLHGISAGKLVKGP